MSKSKYAKEFSKNNISNISKGNAPIAIEEQWLGSRFSSYELHHKKPIWDGGDVYNLDNLVIVSPRYHQEICSKYNVPFKIKSCICFVYKWIPIYKKFDITSFFHMIMIYN